MKQLILLRGCPASGKSTFVKENGLEPYTLSPDVLRTQWSAPVYDTNGKAVISQENDRQVWESLFHILEERMKKGEFIVVDATHSTAKLINKYKQLRADYGYRTYVVDFNVPLDVCLERNAQRESHKFVPEEVIENIHERLQHENIPSFAKVVKPEDLFEEIKWKAQDFNHFDKIHVIGDVHGCYTALNQLMNYEQVADNQNIAYVFVGDLFDRGLENTKVFEFIESIYQLPNVFIIEGNHERHLRGYVKRHSELVEKSLKEGKSDNQVFKEYYRASGFIETTLKEFVDNGITPERVKPLLKKLLQCLYIEYAGTKYIITHGGILPNMVDSLNLVSTYQLINGVGEYEFEIDDVWGREVSESKLIQIHGHRNLYRNPLEVTNSINLEGRVEKGGSLRFAILFNNGAIAVQEIENDVFDSKWLLSNKHTDQLDEDITVEQFIKLADTNNKDVKVKHQYDNVHSINFTNKLFNSRKWNQLAVHARGLFVRKDGENSKVLGRAYNKFFNINEMKETKIENMVDTIQFPLYGYKKENGYLGLMFYDEEIDEIIFASKSTTHLNQYNNQYAVELKRIFETTLNNEQKNEIIEMLKENSDTFLFEVISPNFDPHIVSYEKEKLIFLDIIRNDLKFGKLDYRTLEMYVRIVLKMEYKKRDFTFNNWTEFYQWYKVAKDDLSIQHEGWVFEDASGFMFKFKSKWYSDWKYMRGLKDGLKSGKAPKQYILQNNPELRRFFYWLKKQDELKWQQDIISLREEFYELDKNSILTEGE